MDSQLTDRAKLQARIARLREELQAELRQVHLPGPVRDRRLNRALAGAGSDTTAQTVDEPEALDSEGLTELETLIHAATEQVRRQHHQAHVSALRNQENLEELLSVLAHDLKHPAVGIQGLLSLIKTDCWEKLDPDNQQNLAMALDECTRMRQMLDQLGVLGKVEGLKPALERVDLSQFLDQQAQRFDPQARQHNTTFEIKAPAQIILLPRLHVEQALSHLIDNALKYGSPGPQNTIEIAARLEDDCCRISITDHGPGIDPRFQQRVFQPFRRLPRTTGDEEIPGGGIGLTAVRRLMHHLEGSVELESVPGQGARFTLVFPIELPGPAASLAGSPEVGP